MGSRRFWIGLAAQAVVFGCGAVAILAWRATLPANALLFAIAGAAAAVWLAGRVANPDAARGPEPEPPIENLERERARRTLQAFLDREPTPLVSSRPGEAANAVNRTARRLFRTDDVLTGPDAELVAAALEGAADARRTVRLTSDGVARTYAISVADVTGAGGGRCGSRR